MVRGPLDRSAPRRPRAAPRGAGRRARRSAARRSRPRGADRSRPDRTRADHLGRRRLDAALDPRRGPLPGQPLRAARGRRRGRRRSTCSPTAPRCSARPTARSWADPTAELASFSPELFLRRTGRDVRSSPIKGTAARPADRHRGVARAGSARALDQGPRRERHDRRPRPQRPRSRRADPAPSRSRRSRGPRPTRASGTSCPTSSARSRPGATTATSFARASRPAR